MTFINWIGIGIMAALVIGGVVTYVCLHRKVKSLDGFGGIMRGEGEKQYRDLPKDSPGTAPE